MMVESREEEQPACVLERRESVENAFEDWSEKGNRRSVSSEQSKLTLKKGAFFANRGQRKASHKKSLKRPIQRKKTNVST